ncbi:glucosamine--fructose-6-phosphate aminotransferase [Thermodesulfovibrio aggregans]|uniref:Glutamine--fructose-6-phosphate aminotransferase [isomerizing] n=1 Tax=Thermodesulfovibrio aggregans TaxID=86166 RepID=A0A0U9HNM5_9BACT|nr:glutamine--fructose-6-phosphate transaminase (isomerizing) [Thermodesulfovibrio aggregans]GAQ94663.1 glucosamine--fructose-6-phosphate aminotransferase [Thermodesulfovibrio aggregans]
MCGIIGYIGDKRAVEIVLDGLKRLEYRGYDSAGIAYFVDGRIKVVKCKGKIKNLEQLLEHENHQVLNSNQKPFVAIGHTRWATHGKPSDVNAHPHCSGGIALVHNGIIENYSELKRELMQEGFKFTSETDTEVIAHLINKYRADLSLEEAVREAVKRLRGSYAVVVIDEKEPDKIIGVRMESPLVVGVMDDEKFIASDVPAFLNHCNRVIFLDDGEIIVLRKDDFKIFDLQGKEKKKKPQTITWTASMAEKGGYKHFMLKEIHEQPRSIADTIRGRVLPDGSRIVYKEIGISYEELALTKKIYLVACGTSYHACLIGKYMIERIARIPVEVDIASEFRYREVPFERDSLFIAITQSGETADTLAALRYAKKSGVKTLTICNVVGSTASREADGVFYTHSGPEIGVASTKAFTSQIVALYIFTFALSKAKRANPADINEIFLSKLFHLPTMAEKALKLEDKIHQLAKEVYKKPNFLYLGRGLNYPVALEGALKLKEISYIHAEGYAAGEMKHGPIALVEEGFPVVFIVSDDLYLEKTLSNMEEIKARDGFIITISSSKEEKLKKLSDRFIYVEGINSYLNTVLFSIPLQLLAYHVAILRGCDVDQPRNLAKSVTVE